MSKKVKLTGVFEYHLLSCSLKNVLLHGIFRNEAIDIDMILLADPVCSCHSLQVSLRIPVAVEDDHGIGCLEVDTQPAGSSGKNEREIRRPWRIKMLY